MISVNIISSVRESRWVLQFWPVLASSFLCALIATWLCKKIALKLGIVDRPDTTVKTHKEPIAYLGGVGIFVGLTVGVVVGIYCLKGQEYFSSSVKWLLGILAGGAIACLIGVMHDLFDVKPWQKILGQITAAAVLVLVGIRPALHYLASPFGWEMSQNMEMILGIPVVIIFVLGATNSLNLLDGIDGLCAGVTAVIAFGMFLLAISLKLQTPTGLGNNIRIIIALVLLGSVCGFWPFNKNPAKIFMGDAGSLLLGFVIAALMMLFAAVHPKWCLSSIVIFGLPILDTTVAFARRWLNKRPVFVPDRGHVYDQMIDRGIGLKKTVHICCAIAAIYALIGLAISCIPPWYALAVSIVVAIVSIVIVTAKGYLKMEGLRGAIRKKQAETK